MKEIGKIIGAMQPIKLKKIRKSERSDIFDTLIARLNSDRAREKLPPINHPRLGQLLQGIPTKDLYALISKMEDGEKRGVPPGAIFWTEIRPHG